MLLVVSMRRAEGVKYPSITTVLSILSQAGIQAWRKRVGEEEANRISHRASTRGTAVHAIVEDYLNNVENYKDKYALNIIDNFLPLKGLLDTRIGKIYAQEVAFVLTPLRCRWSSRLCCRV